MNQLKAHPLEYEVEKILQTLEINIATARKIFDTGSMYRFIFNDVCCYVALPTYNSTQLKNIVRLEFIIGKVDKKNVGRLLFAIGLEMDFQSHQIIRAIPRTKNGREYEIILQVVCSLDQIKPGFITTIILNGAELANFFHLEFFVTHPAAS